jgi:transcriptional regulator with XRE-family HTH domain
VESTLRRLRLARGLSQEDVLRRVGPGISLSTIRGLDRGEHLPNAAALLRIARAFDTPIAEFILDPALKASGRAMFVD